ncbi:MAG: hypothetical protein IT427_01145 [Pirellulales bacterium]|nr:hypothetical protein [Pirellulales bacterium]
MSAQPERAKRTGGIPAAWTQTGQSPQNQLKTRKVRVGTASVTALGWYDDQSRIFSLTTSL